MSQSDVRKFTVTVRFAFALWMVILVGISMLSVPYKLRFHIIGPHHDLNHYVAFVVTALFLWMISDTSLGRATGFLAGTAFAYSQEWAEHAIYHAPFEARDVRTDLAGLISGFALMILIKALMSENGA